MLHHLAVRLTFLNSSRNIVVLGIYLGDICDVMLSFILKSLNLFCIYFEKNNSASVCMGDDTFCVAY